MLTLKTIDAHAAGEPLRLIVDGFPSPRGATMLEKREWVKQRADVAFGGAFYAIVDSESAGLPIDAAHLPELRRLGMQIKHAIEARHTIAHPVDAGLKGIYGTIFTGPPASSGTSGSPADLRNVTIF